MAVSFSPTYNVTKLFFDRAAIEQRIGVARKRVLSRQGAFVRTTARRRVLRRRKRVSRPGQAPSVHSKLAVQSLRNILFFYDPRSDSVVVGPVKLNQVNQTTSGRVTVPQLLNFGGSAKIHEVQYRSGGKWFRRDLRRRKRPGQRLRVRTAKYRPRPFMNLALEHEIQQGTIAASWKNAIRGS